jgi:hypothetical protein
MILCASSRCRIRARHTTDCVDEDCKGCLKRRALDGLNLCDVCTNRIGEDAAAAAELWHELELVLARASGTGEKTSGSRERGLRVNERALEARTLIRHTLVSWCLMVSEERGIAAPRDTVTAMGEYLNKHRQWLSAHPAAKDCSDEMWELAHGRTWRAAFPNPVTIVPLGRCPMPDCPGTITAVVRKGDALLPSSVDCDQPPADGALTPHHWPWGSDEWKVLKRDLIMAMEVYVIAA